MGWTWRDDAFKGMSDEQQEKAMEKNEPRVEAIAKEISDLRKQRENEGFIRQSRLEEDGGWCPEDDEDDEDIRADHEMRERIKTEQEDAELRVLEEELHKLGARMMRPYEHWNEDEKFMEWSERDRG